MENPMDEPRDARAAEPAETGADAESYTAATVPPRSYERPPLPPLPAPSYVTPDPRSAQVKAPMLALFLSFFPGLGQLYNEQPAKAVTFFFGFVGAIYGAAEISPLPFAFLIPFVWFYNLIDAWTTANEINRRARTGELVRKDTTLESPGWGASLLVLGLVLLLNNLGWLRLAALSRYWPLALVVAGGVFLARALRARQAPAVRGPFDDRPL
jgi:TM2 domain-containing membrane protein YozV